MTKKTIDAHINLTPDGRWFDTGHEASVERALREMDAAGLDRAGVIPMVGPEQRDFTVEIARRYPDRFYTGFAIGSVDKNELAALRRALKAPDCRFVKLHPRSAGITPLDHRLDPFLAAASEAGRPLIVCGYMRGPSLPMRDLQPLVFDELARRWPDLVIIIAHAGSYRPLDALAVAQSHPNVYLELSHVLAYFRGSSLEQDFRFILQRLDRKVIYGSDFPEYPIDGYLHGARAIAADLNDFETEGFFGGLARRLFGLDD